MYEENAIRLPTVLNTCIGIRYARSVALLILLAVSPYCADSRVMREIAGAPPGSEGFIDAHTMWVAAGSLPDDRIVDPATRKTSARDKAVILASQRALQFLTGYTVEGAYGAFDMDYISRCIIARFGETVAKGTVARESYGKDGRCEIIYSVRSHRLKREIGRCVSEDK